MAEHQDAALHAAPLPTALAAVGVPVKGHGAADVGRRLAVLPGVDGLIPGLALKILKYKTEWALI